MQQLRFYSSHWLYSTCFGRQSHPSSGVHKKIKIKIKTQLLHLVGLISLLTYSLISGRNLLCLWRRQIVSASVIMQTVQKIGSIHNHGTKLSYKYYYALQWIHNNNISSWFVESDVLLTVHLGIFLVNNQLDANFCLYMFISILYMFRAFKCSSSGE